MAEAPWAAFYSVWAPFYDHTSEGAICILKAAIQMTDNPSRRLALFAYTGKLQSFPIPLTSRVLAPTEWSPLAIRRISERPLDDAQSQIGP